jgi:hypothetical protein
LSTSPGDAVSDSTKSAPFLYTPYAPYTRSTRV